MSYDVAAFGAITLGVPAAGTGGDAAAICFNPAVGQAACVVAVALVAAAFYYRLPQLRS